MALNTEYDIVKAFDAIENELMSSMIRNMKRHKVEEIDEDKQWSMWQTEQLKALEKYRRNNEKKFGKEFKKINANIEALIRVAQSEGQMSQEVAILKAIKDGFKANKVSKGASAEFFRLNERKLEALIDSVNKDMQKAETAVLRMANDQYRKIIYNAQVYANTGAGTYEKAVDMATKDFLAAGLNCVEYSNGARHTLKDYADMAIRTASKRAYLQGEGTKRQEWGISTVIVNKRGNPCPKCLPFCGKVLIDDVWSGGSKKDGNYPLMSYAVSQGLYHPRCKDSHTTYFPGISTADDTWTEKELDAIGLNAKMEAKQQYAKRQVEKFERLEKYSLDEENKRLYNTRAEEWKKTFVDGGSKDELTSIGNDDKMKVSKMSDLSTDGKRNENPLSEEQIEEVKQAIYKQGYNGQIIYSDYSNTSFHGSTEGDEFHYMVIGTDAYPIDTNNGSANEKVSMNGCMAHEVVGHYEAWKKGTTQSDGLLEEVQASIRASKFGVDLTDEERDILYDDAIERLNRAKISLKDVEKTLDIWER